MNLPRKESSEYPLTSSQIEKIGNAIVFLAEKIQPLYKTKALKLLYLIEEISIRRNGIPFFGVDFQLWRLGPVVKDVYIDMTAQAVLLSNFIDKKNETDEAISIIPKVAFNDDEFSDSDLFILELVADKFKNTSAQELIQITHREGFPWRETAKRTGYLELFEKNRCNSTDIVLDLSVLLDEYPEKKSFYLHTLDYLKESGSLKGNC